MKNVYMCLIVVFFAVFSPIAQGEEGKGFDVQLGLGSVPIEKTNGRKSWDERMGVTLQYLSPGNLWGYDVEYRASVGQIKNGEFGHAGGYVHKTILAGSIGKISIGVFAGAIKYPGNTDGDSGEISPTVLPTASACLKNNICLDTTFIPKGQRNPGGTTLLFMTRLPIRHW